MGENNSIIKYILLFICFLTMSLLIELFGFNYKILTLKDHEKGLIEVDYKVTKEDDKKILQCNLNRIYVNKFRIKYSASQDVEYSIHYQELDYYHKEKENELHDIFDNETNESITNLKNKITNIEIIYDSQEEITISKIYIDNKLYINYFRVTFMVMVFWAIFLLYHFYKKGRGLIHLHRYFILLGLILGGTMIFLQPSATYYSWDDQIHFANVYEIMGGYHHWTIGELSMVDMKAIGRDSIDSLEEQDNQKEYLNKKSETDYSTNTGRFIPYNKVAYIPSAIGYHFSKLLHLPFDICFKMGKFMNLLAYLLIIGYAIKIAKIGKRLLVVLGLIPTSLFLACQYSYDPAVISGFLLAMTCLFNWFVDKKSVVDFKNLFIFLGAILYSCFPKAVYVPFILLFLFIPTNRFQNRKQATWIKIGIASICLLMMATFVLPTVSGSAIAGDARGGDTSIAKQLQMIIQYPIGYVQVLNDTMIKSFADRMLGESAFGSYAYIGNISHNLYLIYLILIIFVAFIDNIDLKLKKIYKYLTLFVTAGVIILIWTALYLSFTPVGSTLIDGVQARYFLPLLLPFLLCLRMGHMKVKISDSIYNVLIMLVPTIVIFISIYQLILCQYCL